jgi:solute carrier family 35 protein E1
MQCPDSVALFLYFLFWYVGNAMYNQYNTVALTAAGGKNGGLTMTVSTMQLGVCTLWASLLYAVGWNPIKMLGGQAPDRMKVPRELTKDDVKKTMPLGFCAACAHSFGVFCLGADPLFGQIVKAGEPVMSGMVNAIFYAKAPSKAKWFCILFIVGGVAFSCLKKDAVTGTYALSFEMRALIFGMLGNTFAAFKGSENAKLMALPGVKDRYAGIQNQFAATEVLAFFISFPVMLLVEGARIFTFLDLLLTNWEFQKGLFLSGFSFYIYNELATMTIKKTGAVTSSVANTAKRVIVLVWMSIVTGKTLTDEQKIGAAIAISFVFVYAVIDDCIKKFAPKKEAPKNGEPAPDQLELGGMAGAAQPLNR